jgi:glutathione S-transferase
MNASAADRHVVPYHAPNSRSAGALVLLEELGADCELHVLDLKKGEQRRPSCLDADIAAARNAV